MQSEGDVLVSVCMITYNQESFIRQAIEGILIQEVSFDYEFIIGDDCSKDDTLSICNEYADKFAHIKVLPARSNLGMLGNFVRTLKSCKGKYIAFCEGDDYWVDPLKLKKQVSCLGNNPNAVFCFTSVLERNRHDEYRLIRQDSGKSIYALEDFILNQDYIGAATFFFRNKITFPEWLYRLKTGDKFLIFQLSSMGDSIYIDEPTAVYRNNGLGVHSALSDTEKVNNIINDFKVFNRGFDYKYDYLFKESLRRSVKYIDYSLKVNLAKPDYKSARRDIYVMSRILPLYEVFSKIPLNELFKCFLGERLSRVLSAIKKYLRTG
jgi:glycosyltransferase involved in cell wall biosynthesis